MNLRIMPARMGLTWLGHGLRAAIRQPLGFVGLLCLVFLSSLLLFSLPVLGTIVWVAAMPVVWMAFMLASRRVLQGQRITPAVFVEPLRAPNPPSMRVQWAQLGGAYVLGILLVMLLAELFGPGSEALREALTSSASMADALDHPDVRMDMLWRAGLTAPLALVFWHTPALLYWGRQPILKALFFSMVACWRNLGAFVVYSLGWIGMVVALMLLINLVAALIPIPWLINTVFSMALMWLVSAFYASLYFTVDGCFEGLDGPTPDLLAAPLSRTGE